MKRAQQWAKQRRRDLLCGVSFLAGELNLLEKHLIMCRSLTHAQRCQRFLERSGIPSALVKAPLPLTRTGCGYALILRRHGLDGARRLRAAGLLEGKVYVQNGEEWSEAGYDLS